MVNWKGLYLQKARCLVTGGKGFIGSHLVERLLDDGHEVIVIDDESAPENEEFHEFDGAAYHKTDICDPGTHSLYEGVDVVFHLAARARIQPTIDDPSHAFVNNVIGTQSVLEASRKANVKRVVYSGSSSVYGLKNHAPQHEDMSPDCLNPYSLSKYQGEQIRELYSRLYNLPTVVLRYFNVYGPREPLRGKYAPVIGIFKKQRAAGEVLTIVGDGTKRRDFTHVLDVVDANLRAASYINWSQPDRAAHDVFNIGTGTNHSINEIAEMVGGSTSHIRDRPAEAQETRAYVVRAEERLGWVATRGLPDMIDSY